jgi:hypothetical protein
LNNNDVSEINEVVKGFVENGMPEENRGITTILLKRLFSIENSLKRIACALEKNK